MAPPKKRSSVVPNPSLNIWIKEGPNFKADVEGLRRAIQDSPNSVEVMQKLMGRGYDNIEKALRGEVLTIWNVKHIEYGLEEPIESKLAPVNTGIFPSQK